MLRESWPLPLGLVPGSRGPSPCHAERGAGRRRNEARNWKPSARGALQSARWWRHRLLKRRRQTLALRGVAGGRTPGGRERSSPAAVRPTFGVLLQGSPTSGCAFAFSKEERAKATTVLYLRLLTIAILCCLSSAVQSSPLFMKQLFREFLRLERVAGARD